MPFTYSSKTILIVTAKVILLSIMLSLVGCNSSSDDVDIFQLLEDVESNKERGELSTAIIKLKTHIRSKPDDSLARIALGKIYLQQGEGENAEKELRAALAFGTEPKSIIEPLFQALLLLQSYQDIIEYPLPAPLPTDTLASLLALKALSFLSSNAIPEGKETLHQARQLSSDNNWVLFVDAQLQRYQGDKTVATTILKKALIRNPNFADGWILLGDIYREIDNPQGAIEGYSKAINAHSRRRDSLLKRSLVYIYLDDFNSAQNDIRFLKKVSPGQPVISYLEGLIFFKQGRYQAADEAFNTAQSENFNPPIVTYYLGKTAHALDKLEQAELYLTTYLSAVPNDTNAAIELGIVQLMKNNLSGAENTIRALAKKHPGNTQVVNLQATLDLMHGNFQAGLARLEQITAKLPESGQAQFKLGQALYLSGDKIRSAQALQKALYLDPELPNAHIALIINHLQSKQFDKAIQETNSYILKYPESPKGYSLLSLAYLGMKDYPSARKHSRKALELSPGHLGASHNLAVMDIAEGNIDSAKQHYLDALKMYPGNVEITVRLAAIYTRQRQFGQAKQLFETAEARNPNHPAPKIFLANYYLNTGEPAKGLDIAISLKGAGQSNRELLLITGKAQLALGRPSAAITTFRTVIKKWPNNIEAHTSLANAYLATQDYSSAQHQFEKALQLDSSDIALNVSVIRLYSLTGQNTKASAHAKKLYKQHPKEHSVIAVSGWLAIRQNKPQQALDYYSRIPDELVNSKLSKDIAQAQWLNNNWEGALLTLNRQIEANPRDIGLKEILAQYLMILHKDEKAIASYQQILEQEAQHTGALNNLAWLLRSSSPNKALEYAKKALEKDPKNSNLNGTLGIVQLELEQFTKAERSLRRAIALGTKNNRHNYYLAKALANTGNKAEAQEILKQLVNSKERFPELPEAIALQKNLSQQ